MPGTDDTRLLAIVRAFRASGLLGRILDKSEFLSDYGVRGRPPFRKSCRRRGLARTRAVRRR